MGTPHILLTENRANLQHSLGLMLKQANYRVQLADTIEEALTLFKGLHNTPLAIALLIVDLDAASEEDCRLFMHALSACGIGIPYLVLAEDICGQTVEALKHHGCLACITKPFEPATLLKSVQHALTRLPSQEGPRKKINTANPVNHSEQSSHPRGEQPCRTNCGATGFHSYSLPRFW